MADTVSTEVIFQGSERYAVRLTNISDGTGETGVTKVDISTLPTYNGQVATYTAVEEIKWDVQGFTSVRLYWDHSTDDIIDVMSCNGVMSYHDIGYLFDPRSSGGTGDILLTTAGSASGNTYDITLIIQLRSA